MVVVVVEVAEEEEDWSTRLMAAVALVDLFEVAVTVDVVVADDLEAV